jgi:hypothetical protein
MGCDQPNGAFNREEIDDDGGDDDDDEPVFWGVPYSSDTPI